MVWAAPAHADAPTDLLASVNNLRSAVSVPALTADVSLTTVAQQWANHMASTDVLAHNPNLSTQAPSGWTKMGENIGEGYSLTAVFNVLAGSPAHYANMVDPAFNHTGIGVATDSSGQVWVVEDFGDYPPPAPPAMVFPTTGTTIFSSPQTFSWSQDTGAQYYCLTVGTTPGGIDLANSGLLPASQLNFAVPAFEGSTPLYARIYAYNQGAWIWSDVTFYASGPSTASLSQPANGASNVDTNQPFTWTALPSAAYYGVSVGTVKGGYDLVNSGPIPGTQTSYAVPALPVGQTLWARLYSYIGGSWNHYTDVSFTAAPRS
jgi:hypothetical protein